MSTTKVRQSLNGVDVTRLVAVTDAIKKNPELKACRFRATNTWLGGGHSQTKIQGFWGAGREDTSRTKPFYLDGDEHPHCWEPIMHLMQLKLCYTVWLRAWQFVLPIMRLRAA